jgi:hypothetical protein
MTGDDSPPVRRDRVGGSVIDIHDIPPKLRELRNGSEVIAWLRELGLEPELVVFAARCAVDGVVAPPSTPHPIGDRATAAFVTGFLSGVGLHQGHSTRRGEAANVIARAARAVAARGRHAIIADHCDLSTIASLEIAFAAELSLGLEESEQASTLLMSLYESGLAVGLAVGDA